MHRWKSHCGTLWALLVWPVKVIHRFLIWHVYIDIKMLFTNDYIHVKKKKTDLQNWGCAHWCGRSRDQTVCQHSAAPAMEEESKINMFSTDLCLSWCQQLTRNAASNVRQLALLPWHFQQLFILWCTFLHFSSSALLKAANQWPEPAGIKYF